MLVVPVGVSGLPGKTCFPILASCAGIGRSRLGNALKPFAGADALKGETAKCTGLFKEFSTFYSKALAKKLQTL